MMTNYIYRLTIVLPAFVGLFLGGCTKENGEHAAQGIFIVPTSRALNEERAFVLSSAPSFINYAVALHQPASGALTVTLSVDNSLIDAYNTANNTSYLPLPEGSYRLVNSSVVIGAGNKVSLQDSLELTSVELDPESVYLIPLKITAVEGGGVTLIPSMAVKYYAVSLKRPDWVVVGFSSEEAVGEGPSNGRVIHAFDGKASTFWHSQWQGGTPGPPHWFTIDMVAPRTINGFKFENRASSNTAGWPKDIEISVSNDNITWTSAGLFTLERQNSSAQTMTFTTPIRTRYFKLTIHSMYDTNSYSNLAELKVF